MGVRGQLCFLRLTELLASEPDTEGGDSPASVTEAGGCAWGQHCAYNGMRLREK